MPKHVKCWYKGCDSNNNDDQKLVYYRFPKETNRCRQWVINCANPELNEIWDKNPDRVVNMRLCQNHFLKEFLGSSCRLVGHAVPAPHGVALGDLDVRNFMVDCANLKSPTPLPQTIQDNSIQDQSHDISQIEPTFNPNESIQVEENHDYDTGYCVPATEVNNDEVTNVMANDIAQEPHPTESLATPPLQISENPFHILDDNDSIGNHVSRSPDLYNMMSAGEYMSNDFNIDSRPITDQSYQRLDLVEPNLTTLENSSTQLVVANEEVIENAQSEYSSEVIIENQPQVSTNTEIRPANRIAYIPCNQLISMTSNRNEPEESSKTNRKRSRQESYDELKLKIRSYQKKLAVVNHRYQALRSRMRGRSKKGRLLEILRNCSDSLNPTLFDIFEHCLTGSKSPHGNRWSDRIKIFATGIYRRSKSAYRFLRTTVELPSESMIKKFMRETELLDQVEDNEFVSSDTDQEDRKEEPSTRKANFACSCLNISYVCFSHIGIQVSKETTRKERDLDNLNMNEMEEILRLNLNLKID